jgi:hypothetical protein
MELRCDSRLHGELVDNKLIVRCRSVFCGKKPGVVVMHIFDLDTGKVETKLYKDPGVRGEQDGMGYLAAVRHA